jgi:hypothetical protein
MPQRKYRYFPEPEADPPVHPRPVDEAHAFVASPVHAMHRNLWTFAEGEAPGPIELYPGWVRLAVPLLGSGGMWLVILWALGVLR